VSGQLGLLSGMGHKIVLYRHIWVNTPSFPLPILSEEGERESGYEEGIRKRGTYKEERSSHKNVNILILS
jgi:hypothetical protein